MKPTTKGISLSGKIIYISLLTLFLPIISLKAMATDLLFLHNGDYVTLIPRSGQTGVSFEFYSISGRSRIDVDKGAGVIEEKIIFKNTDGWKSISYGIEWVKLIIKEGPGGGDMPSDSDVVIRFDHTKVIASYMHHEDGYQKGTKCKSCGKLLNW